MENIKTPDSALNKRVYKPLIGLLTSLSLMSCDAFRGDLDKVITKSPDGELSTITHVLSANKKDIEDGKVTTGEIEYYQNATKKVIDSYKIILSESKEARGFKVTDTVGTIYEDTKSGGQVLVKLKNKQDESVEDAKYFSGL